ncbi:MAG TPA: Fe-Mn family superoxide dismutase [Burkholderiales bacterium]|nr:Fe-Mn family superoxide dismutase [Burkholderiales bacterium]
MQPRSHTVKAPIALPALPYTTNALEPMMSKETLEYHYGKHHRAYVSALNALIAGTPFEFLPLEEIIMRASGTIFNNAAQVWNHTFYWHCLTPMGSGGPGGDLASAITRGAGSLEALKAAFTKKALEKFGSGWTWLVRARDGHLLLRNTDDADTPLRFGETALLACDVWEHAYYIDHRNDRAGYLAAFWSLVDWRFVEARFRAHAERRSAQDEAETGLAR